VSLPPASDYGQCPCSGVYERRVVEVRMTIRGEVVTLVDVPQGACPLCGSRVYKTGTLEGIEALMRGQPTHPPRALL
jgi:YgiT-type zinc finger domain-containing protein